MLVVSKFLLSDIRPLIARMIYDPNDPDIMIYIVEKLTRFGEKIPGLLSDGTLSSEALQRYNNWLKEFLVIMEKKDYIMVLQGLHPKVLK